MKTVTINTKVSPYGHSFSFLKKEKNGSFTPELMFASCRSFMCDTLFSAKNKKYKILPGYPFKIDYKKGNIFIGIYFPSAESRAIFIKNIPKLHEIEKIAKVTRSVV